MQKLFALAGLFLLVFMGCAQQPSEAQPQAQPERAPLCGDGVCDAGENASCCSDCGCQAGFQCNDASGLCEPGPDYIFERTMGVFENATSYSAVSSLSVLMEYEEDGMRHLVRSDTYFEEDLDFPQQKYYMYTRTGNTTTELYAIGNLSYVKYPDFGWVKEELEPSFWDTINETNEETWMLASRMRHALNGSSSVNGRDCWLLSLFPTTPSQNREMKEILAKPAGESSEYIEMISDLRIDLWNLCVDKESYGMLSSNISMSGTIEGVSIFFESGSIYNYEPVVVVLPFAARDARALPFELKYYDKYCEGIDPRNSLVRQQAAAAASAHSGELSVEQIADIYEFVHTEIAYVSDPRRPDLESYPYSPEQTLLAGAGDCDDQAVLFASMVEAIGGWSRVVINTACGHAYTEVYIGDSESAADAAMQALFDYYSPDYITVRWRTDEDGTKWMIFDPAGGEYAGDLHPDCYSQTDEDSWEDAGTEANLFYVYSCVE
ncbi:MAG: transglutaminase domain-containing protein [Candidatus Micrarchaeota archaeon]